MKLTEKQYQMFMNNRLNAKVNKYHNKKIEYDNLKFDSIKEKNHYILLKQLQEYGLISDLKLQVKFELQPSFKYNGQVIRSINYVADFVYYDTAINKTIVVDVKGFKTKEYLLKKKMFLYRYPEYIFKEI